MSRFWQILIVLLLILGGYLVARGLGLTNSFKRHKNDKKTFVINDFEYPNDDLDWWTGGYVKIESAKENQTHGKRSGKAIFLLKSQFYPASTPLAPPLAVPTTVTTSVSSAATLGSPLAASEDSWHPSMTLNKDSVTKLGKYDWSEFTSLKMDAFNPLDRAVTYHLQVADGRAFTHEMSGPLTPKKVTNISLPLDDLIKDRLDLTSIQSLTFSVDAIGTTKPAEVYLDYLRLESEPAAPLSKK